MNSRAIITVPGELIERRIYLIRGQKVMLDRDLAELYGVPVKRLNEQVKRNMQRFPEDFSFQLDADETSALRSQFATLEKGRGKYSKYPLRVFTEHGILMLSSVLNSGRAITVNIAIMRVFVRLKQIIVEHKDLAIRMEKIERAVEKHGEQIQTVLGIVKQLIEEEENPKPRIGFHQQ